MSTKTPPATEAPAGNVVHLVNTHSSSAPEALQFGRRITGATALVLWGLLVAAAVGTTALLVALGTSDSPGWWFNVLFTVLPALFLFGCAVALLESQRASKRERELSERWASTHGRARPTAGKVVARDVQLMEHGGVSSFTVTVEADDGRTIHARWFRTSPAHEGGTLLQPQVPAIGSDARIWAVPGPAVDEPCVVEALDPSAAPR